MKIVVDVFGGDNAPNEILEGCKQAIEETSDLNLVLVGKDDIINSYVDNNNIDKNRVEVINAPDIITNEEHPVEAIRSKKDSSLVVALKHLQNNEDCCGFVSAGSTGAVLTGATLIVRRIKNIFRPALAPVLPTVKDKSVILVDCGANVDCKPEMLNQFAVMGSVYAKAVNNCDNPKVGLLNNGVEEGKGNLLTKETYNLLKENNDITFAGNIEAREILSGDVDVVVTDGFAGNVALKSCEGTALSMFSIIKKNILGGGLRAKLGYLLLKPAFKNVKKTMDYNDNGGAIMLGLSKVIIKSHGSSKAKAIKNSIIQCYNLVNSKIVERITETIGQ
ncbi:MAG: phosphate acyltransferase PlsX [Clostridia bacterium]|nr:phosphate acyltransferase PlsX [Clostridia bacterium]